MSRNANSRFALNPTSIDISRSKFNRNHSYKTSFNVGQLIPFYVDEVLPGDTHQIKTSKVVRLQTLITPVMDNIYLDTYYFFVPNRILWDHWKQLNGENTTSAWTQDVEYSVPTVKAPEGGWNVGTIADYMGIPTGVENLEVNALPFRAYNMIVNEWFRDQNNLDPCDIVTDDANVNGSNGNNYITDLRLGGMPFIATKFADYFTSCLPSPQKGPDIGIGLTGNIPVVGNGNALLFSDGTNVHPAMAHGVQYNTGVSGNSTGIMFDSGTDNKPLGSASTRGGSFSGALGIATSGDTGLEADLSGITNISINALRIAFQTQKMYEKDARGGTRYREMLKAHFGVNSPDARQQIPEYLGGNRIPISINQVVQTSGEVGNTPTGNTAAYSVTTDIHGDFIKSFTEHGFIIGLCVARYDHTYQQGLQRFWSRKNRLDYYLPVFANIGEQPVYMKEIFADGTSQDDDVFGYQEAWADYRYFPSMVTGEMRSQYAQSLDVWHLADYYSTAPTLQSSWIQEDKSNVDRVLQVSSTVSNQLFGDFYIMNETTRPMPLYSIPGLIDHH